MHIQFWKLLTFGLESDTVTNKPDIVSDAQQIATDAHITQRRWDGTRYIHHPRAVVKLLDEDGYSDEVIAVGWLHDVVEDSSWTLEALAEYFPPNVIAGIDAMTHRKGESYLDYIMRVARDPIGRIVKVADITHNRQSFTPEQKRERKDLYQKYALALKLLEWAPIMLEDV